MVPTNRLSVLPHLHKIREDDLTPLSTGPGQRSPDRRCRRYCHCPTRQWYLHPRSCTDHSQLWIGNFRCWFSRHQHRPDISRRCCRCLRACPVTGYMTPLPASPFRAPCRDFAPNLSIPLVDATAELYMPLSSPHTTTLCASGAPIARASIPRASVNLLTSSGMRSHTNICSGVCRSLMPVTHTLGGLRELLRDTVESEYSLSQQ